MRRAIAIGAVTLAALAAGCKGSDPAKPADPPTTTTTGSATGEPRKGPALATPASITVPLADGASWPPRARILIVTAQGLLLAADGAPPVVDANGRLELPDARSITIADLATALPPDASAVVVADAGAQAGVVTPVVAALGLRCWGLGVGSRGALAALASQPCPPTAPTDPALVQLGVSVGRDGSVVGVSRVDEFTAVADLAALERVLGEHKASAFFTDRADVAIAVDDGVTVGELATALGAALRAGFTNARWVPPAALPARAQPGGATGRPAVAGSTGGSAAAIPKISIGAITGDFGGHTADELARVIKARAGVLRACYQRELARDAALAGDMTLSFQIGADGVVASVDASGPFAAGAVGNCAKAQIHRMKFPAKGAADVAVTITFAPA
jgi:hypothetical protein